MLVAHYQPFSGLPQLLFSMTTKAPGEQKVTATTKYKVDGGSLPACEPELHDGSHQYQPVHNRRIPPPGTSHAKGKETTSSTATRVVISNNTKDRTEDNQGTSSNAKKSTQRFITWRFLRPRSTVRLDDVW
ncbi:hypothetical protein E2C01_034683 [Portunus trituberculatus]|uniref:Uncharacterized protein n=1 Tax=Portunus trituberculatus TaxID=210409 RepID=A0A5B7F179_PORTR|nr:hypothetical protein [Portunus trituberculatus]